MTWDQFTLYFSEWWSSLTFIVSTLFVLYYGTCAPWWKTPFGRALIIIDLGLAVATFPAALMSWTGVDVSADRLTELVIIVVATPVPLAIAYRLCVMISVRHSKMWKQISRKDSE